MNRNPLLPILLVILIALLSVALPLSVHAQLTYPIPPCVAASAAARTPQPAASVPAGMLPVELGGTCTSVLESNAQGYAAAWYCPIPTGVYHAEWAIESGEVTPGRVADMLKLLLPGDRAARIASLQAKYPSTKNIADLCGVWGPARDRMNAAYAAALPAPPASSPAAPAWVVAGAPGSAALQWATDGRSLGALQTARTVAGTACICPAAPLKVGGRTYCQPTGSPATNVAICTRTP